MEPPSHPGRETLELEPLMHCFSDPIRTEIARTLADVHERPCTDFHGLNGLTLATLSYHLRVLREAGVTNTRIDGRNRYISLRREDLEWRFPGLLQPILDAARDQHVASSTKST